MLDECGVANFFFFFFKIADLEELRAFQAEKRQFFEAQLHRGSRGAKKDSTWIQYANFEVEQNEISKARSIFERALETKSQEPKIWVKYAEMEMRQKNFNHARNVFDRAVIVLPRADELWFRYVFMEEALGHYSGCRVLFERWMEWQPPAYAWKAYVKFEMRYEELDKAREVFRRYVVVHPHVEVYLKWAKMEKNAGETANARAVLENCHEFLKDKAEVFEYFDAFARFEEENREVERARAIYKYALDKVPKDQATQMYRAYVAFEKQHGDGNGIEVAIAARRRFLYEEELKLNPRNYDVWFDYARLEQAHAKSPDVVRDVYERAIANVPPVAEKRFWMRYIWIWISYAMYEELDCNDAERARAVWTECLNVIPHQIFTFSKLWVMFAMFEVRQKQIAAARKVFGTALGKAPRPKTFSAYINFELQLGEIDRVRTLYQKMLQCYPERSQGWCEFADFEKGLKEFERAKAILEIATRQANLDAPEVVWKFYIDMQMERKEWDEVRSVFRRLLQQTSHPRVWEAFARFEFSQNNVEGARAVYLEAFDGPLKTEDTRPERFQLLELWKEFEEDVADKYGEEAAKFEMIKTRVPKRIKKKRKLETPDGTDAGYEEYYDYLFPDMAQAAPNMKLLEMAQKWKAAKAAEAEIKKE